MTEKELHDARRAELLASIMSELSGPQVPVPPKPLANDATNEQKAAHEAAQRDYGIQVSLNKSAADLSGTEEGNRL